MWLPREEEQPVPAPRNDGEGTLRFINCVSVAEKNSSGESVVDVEPLRFHYSVLVISAGDAAKGPCVQLVVLNSGSGTSFIEERGLVHTADVAGSSRVVRL